MQLCESKGVLQKCNTRCALPSSDTGGGRARDQILTGFAIAKLAAPKQKPPLKEWWFVWSC